MLSLPRSIRISKDKHFLTDEYDRKWFYLADTWWFGMTPRMPIEIFTQLAKLRKKQGFNAIQIVIGFPPESNKNELTIDDRYFSDVEKKLNILWNNGLVPCIFGGWGHHMDTLGVEWTKNLWDKIIQLTKGKVAIFSLCGEVDIFPYSNQMFLPSSFRRITKPFRKFIDPFILRTRLNKWSLIAQHIKTHDQEHLLTVHVQSQTSARLLFNNPQWLDINSIQSGHSLDRLPFMIDMLTKESKQPMPVINLEPWYEGILGNFGPSHQVQAFNVSVQTGAAGHSYGAHGIWQMANNDNFMGHWGKSNWKEAIEFKGAEKIGKLASKMQEA